MGLIKTGITAGAALGAVKMVTNHMEKSQSMRGNGNNGGYPQQSPVPAHPQCTCPHCPQNMYAQGPPQLAPPQQQAYGGYIDQNAYYAQPPYGYAPARGYSPVPPQANYDQRDRYEPAPSYSGRVNPGQGYIEELSTGNGKY